LAARARPCAARTRLFELIATQNRALRAHPSPLPIAASLLLSRPPKIYKIYRTWAAHRSFPDPSGNILWSKLCTGATGSFLYSSLICSFCYSLLFSSLLLFPSYPSFLILLFLSLLILLVGTILRLLILLFLYFKLFVVLRTKYIRHSEGFFEGAKPFLIHLGSKLIYTVRPYGTFFTFFVSSFYCFIFSSCYSLLILLFISLFLFFSSYNWYLNGLLYIIVYIEKTPRNVPVWQKIPQSIPLLI
jgi:hypothetical protein